MIAVNTISHSKTIPNAHITAISPIVSATVSQYLPKWDGLSRIRASSPSTASITPLRINKKQLSTIYPSKISHAQNRESKKCKFVTWITEIGFFSRNLAAIRAKGRPHSERFRTSTVPYLLLPLVMLFSITKHPVSKQSYDAMESSEHDYYSSISSTSFDARIRVGAQRPTNIPKLSSPVTK